MGEQFKWNPSEERIGVMLRQAVHMEDIVTLEHLLKQRADLEARDEAGSTALHIAATQCKLGMVEWLLKAGADLHAKDSDGFCALTWSCIKGHLPIVSALLERSAELNGLTDSMGKTPLALSAERGHFDCVMELLKRRADIDGKNSDDSTALMCAAHHSEAQVVAHLLAKQAIVNLADNQGWTPLMFAVNSPSPPVSSGGEAAERKVNIDGVMGKRSTAELIMLHGANVNAQTVDGLTPLIIASGRERPVAVKKLLEFRAQVNMITAKGQSALIMACSGPGHDMAQTLQLVRSLIVANAEVNHATEKKDTPLSLAEKCGHVEIADLLKRSGAVEPKAGKKKGKKK